jgi:prepilin-type N-terminal cleavage/methylation domain-containing protein
MRRAGFTLLETLVALAITALVLSALYGAVSHAAAARARTSERADELAVARGVLLRMTRELEAAVVPQEPGTPDRFVVVPAADGASSSNLRFASAGTEIVGYDVTRDAAGRSALVRRAASRFAAAETAGPVPVPILAGVARFVVRCHDGAEWRDRWDVPTLPRAVEITLGVDDGAGGVDVLATTVALPLAGS